MDAYKGYHQIKIAKEDEEKTAFIISQGVFCYSKMPFGLRNARATYQRLVDKAFHKQIGRNLEVYMDDLVIKSRTEDEIIRDIKETFKTLRKINMKLNPRKCTFGVEEGMFLEKSNFHWAEAAFKQMKQLIAELPTLTAPEKKELTVYLAAAKEAGQILADFIVERPEENNPDTAMEVEKELPESWILFIDGSSCADGSGAGLILTNPEGEIVVEEDGNTWMTPIYEYLTEETLPAEVNKARVIRRTRSLVAKAMRTRYYWPTMHKDARALIRAYQDCQGYKPVLRNPQKKLNPITSPWPFYKWRIDIAGPFPEGPALCFCKTSASKWVSRKGKPKLRGMDQGKARRKKQELDGRNLPFIPAEIGMPTLRTAKVDMVQNNEALGINLDLLEERREQAAIHEAKSKEKMKKYYNSKVRSTSFKPGDLVYRSNDAIRTEEVGKLGPKWEGPYEIIKALVKGTYKLRDRDGKQLSRI
uniref:Reverse transcriptase domain-containing protein n=1 Tax=Tanacetum cinerariifolium TaxID=118510 RepID=A0A6L2MV99_TANCI|nr:reverse transcriptase domain-containing protein [Tanacetum cinerariifolium]